MQGDTRSPASVASIAPDMGSSDRTGSLTYSGANGEFQLTAFVIGRLSWIMSSRYCNMDFALMSTLIPSLNDGISRVLVSYDIACQWHKNLQSHLSSYRSLPPVQLSTLKYWKVAVPKFHLPAHGTSCQLAYNLAYTKHAGRMDSERIEAGWSQTNSMATWTRESGPNARRDILDDHWNASNWKRLVGLGEHSVFSFNYPPEQPGRQAHPSTGSFGNLSHGVCPNGRWRASFPRAIPKVLSNSGEKCGTTSIVTPPSQIRTRKSKIVRPFFFFFSRSLIQFSDYKMAQLREELLKEDIKQVSSAANLPSEVIPAGSFFRKAIEIEDRL